MELVHLAADSPLVSWRDRDLKFFQAPYMQQCPELEKGEGASFGTSLARASGLVDLCYVMTIDSYPPSRPVAT